MILNTTCLPHDYFKGWRNVERTEVFHRKSKETKVKSKTCCVAQISSVFFLCCVSRRPLWPVRGATNSGWETPASVCEQHVIVLVIRRWDGADFSHLVHYWAVWIFICRWACVFSMQNNCCCQINVAESKEHNISLYEWMYFPPLPCINPIWKKLPINVLLMMLKRCWIHS